MDLFSKPKLEGLGLEGQFPFTVRGELEAGVIIVVQENVVHNLQWYQPTLLSKKAAIR